MPPAEVSIGLTFNMLSDRTSYNLALGHKQVNQHFSLAYTHSVCENPLNFKCLLMFASVAPLSLKKIHCFYLTDKEEQSPTPWKWNNIQQATIPRMFEVLRERTNGMGYCQRIP